jgi:hypothetical protein
MWVLLAVSVGGELMGVGGMLVMIPLTSVLYSLMREFTDKRLAQRNIPQEKLDNPPPERREQRENKATRQLRKKLEQIKYKKK